MSIVVAWELTYYSANYFRRTLEYRRAVRNRETSRMQAGCIACICHVVTFFPSVKLIVCSVICSLPPSRTKDLRRNLVLLFSLDQVYSLMPFDIHNQFLMLIITLARPLHQMHMYDALP